MFTAWTRQRHDHLSGTISHQSTLCFCPVCGHAVLHRNVLGLYDTLNLFHCFVTNKQPKNYTATQRAVSTCCLSHCGSPIGCAKITFLCAITLRCYINIWKYLTKLVKNLRVIFSFKKQKKKHNILYRDSAKNQFKVILMIANVSFDFFSRTWRIICIETTLDLCNFKRKSSELAKTFMFYCTFEIYIFKKLTSKGESQRNLLNCEGKEVEKKCVISHSCTYNNTKDKSWCAVSWIQLSTFEKAFCVIWSNFSPVAVANKCCITKSSLDN